MKTRVFIVLTFFGIAVPTYSGNEPSRKALTEEADPYFPDPNPIREIEGYVYSWGDEFNVDGPVNKKIWAFETGLKRGNEAQCYTDRTDNAYVEGGRLKIMGKKEKFKNPNYDPSSSDWRKKTEYTQFTSASMIGKNRRHFLFGRIEVRARINPKEGAFPAIWTCGYNKDWPANGEIDIMEYYNKNGGAPHLTANFCVSPCDPKDKWATKWNSNFTPLTYYTAKDPDWIKKYHVWRMDWDEEQITLYVDDEPKNSIKIKDFKNGDGSIAFYNTQYMWLNLALKDFGYGIEDNQLYEVDYFRVYQKYVDHECPTPVTGLNASEVTDTSCRLTWNSSKDNVGVYRYDVYKDGMGEGYFACSSTDTSVVVTGLTPDKEAKFYVRALDYVGNYSFYDIDKTFDENNPVKIKTQTEFSALTVPSDIYSDILLKTKTASGNTITWRSSDLTVLTSKGIVTYPDQKTELTLTASINVVGEKPRVFNVTVHPRNIENNKVLHYQFETNDVYTTGEQLYVKDVSGNHYDAAVYGKAKINGTLDLTANTLTGFSGNGYAMLPNGIIENLRSYSCVVTVRPTHLNSQPRIYDFGSGATNSIFGRLNGFCAGLKYNGGSTVLINASKSLSVNKESKLAFTFDAKTKMTKIYLNGEEVAGGTTFAYEPYQVAEIGNNFRNYIGRTQWWDSGSASSNADYCGTVDDFFLFDVALTKEELRSLLSTTSLNAIPVSSVMIYPNPVPENGSFFINLEGEEGQDSKVEILNIQGQSVQSLQPAGYPVEIKNTLLSGIYLVRITTKENQMIYQGKLLVQ